MRYADPEAQKRIDELEAQLERVKVLVENNRKRNRRNDVSLGFTMRYGDGLYDTWIREDALLAVLS